MISEPTISIPSHVLAEMLNDETILLDMSNGMYFGLTPVASRFWKLLAEGMPREEINLILLNEFEIEPDVLKADLDALLAELDAKKLIDRKTI